MGKLHGKIALVTGGNSGIGLATAKQFAQEGAYVFITARRERELAEAVNQIGKRATGVHGDVANLTDLDRLFAQIKREKGRLDVLFANAGIAKYARLGEITEELCDLWRQRKRPAVHGAEGAPASARSRLHHIERIHCRQQRLVIEQRL